MSKHCFALKIQTQRFLKVKQVFTIEVATSFYLDRSNTRIHKEKIHPKDSEWCHNAGLC